MAGSIYCPRCEKTLNEKEFYGSNNLEKYPSGKLPQCKKCLTAHVDNWDPETYVWILEEADVPYVPDEWNKILVKYGQSPESVTGMTIMGRYLAKMRLAQYNKLRWKDTEFLQQKKEKEIREAMSRQGFDEQAISDAIEKNIIAAPDKPKMPEPANDATGVPDYFDQQDGFGEITFDLTDDEKLSLRLKWGKGYRIDEWVSLEQLYSEMMESYDIQAAGDINTLKLACKASLKANQLMDIGDIDGAQKCTKMYDSLMKSGKWTAAQNKAESSEDINSVGELVALCEKEGFIPRFYTDGPQDKIDRVLEDMQRYTRNLIENETNLSNLIEVAAKQMVEESERIAAAAASSTEDTEQSEEEKLFNYDAPVIQDADYSELSDFIESELDEDALDEMEGAL